MAAADPLQPQSSADIGDAITHAAATGTALEIVGGGSKSEISYPDREIRRLDMRAFSGIVDYDPAELVLTARAATPLAEIEALLLEQGQMLAFEPFDHGPLFGNAAKDATIGGIIAAAVAGSRRISAGGARDHLLGFSAVSGRGESFVAGGKVVKNVTGYDLPKLIAGSWGRLVVLTEVTLKVLPRPRTSATLAVHGLSDGEAVSMMTRLMGSQCEIAAAGHIPAASPMAAAVTMLRIEGFAQSVTARSAMLRAFVDTPQAETLEPVQADAYWRSLREFDTLPRDWPLWRINLPPTNGARFTQGFVDSGARWLFDWAGGLVWLAAPPTLDGDRLRAAATALGGHAMLVRAEPALRRRLSPLHPEPAGVAALSRRVKAAFDPAGVLDPHRFRSASDAD